MIRWEAVHRNELGLLSQSFQVVRCSSGHRFGSISIPSPEGLGNAAVLRKGAAAG